MPFQPEILPSRARQQAVLRDLARVLADGGRDPFLSAAIAVEADEPLAQARVWRAARGLPAGDGRQVALTAVCLGLGVALAVDELAERGLDGAKVRDPSVEWRRPGPQIDLSSVFATLGLPAPTESDPLTARELVFAVAAQVVARHPTAWARAPFGPAWRARALPAPLRPVFAAAVAELAVPRGALAGQLGVGPMPRARRRKLQMPDGSEHYWDYDDLLGVQRVRARRRGLVGKLLGERTERLRCSSPRCRAPLPTWSPRCVACGRPVQGEPPLGPTS